LGIDVYEGQLFTIFKTPMFSELAGGDRSPSTGRETSALRFS
jgi:hypothetical protein